MDYIRKRIPYYERKFGVSQLHVSPSPRKDKRYSATFLRGGKSYIRHFGKPGAHTFSDDQTLKKKRALYQARHSQIKDIRGRLAYLVPGSPSSLSYFLLW